MKPGFSHTGKTSTGNTNTVETSTHAQLVADIFAELLLDGKIAAPPDTTTWLTGLLSVWMTPDFRGFGFSGWKGHRGGDDGNRTRVISLEN